MISKKALILEEVEYFNPKDTVGQLLLDVFNKKQFLSDAKIFNGKGYIYLTKEFFLSDTLNRVRIYFEKKPFNLKKFEINNDSGITSFTILDPNFNPNLNKKIFSLVNPTLR